MENTSSHIYNGNMKMENVINSTWQTATILWVVIWP